MARTMRIKGEGLKESDFSNAEKALNNLGIKIRNVNTGEMRDFLDIMNEVSSAWDTMTEADQFNLGEQLGGVRQLSQVLGMIKNMPRINELTDIGRNSEGAGLEAQAQWADSLEAKYKSLTNATQIFWQTFINSDAVKNGLDLLTSLVNGATKLTDTFGSLAVSVSTLSGAFILFTDNPLKKFFGELTTEKILGMGTQFKDLAKQMLTVKNGSLGLVTAFHSAGGATGVLSLGLKAVGASALFAQVKVMMLQITFTAGLMVAITVVVSAISAFVSHLFSAGESMDEFNRESIKTADGLTGTIHSAEQAYSKIQDLEKQISETTDLSKRNELTKELTETQKALADILPETSSAIDSNGQALATNNALIEENLKLKRDELAINAMEYHSENLGKNNLDRLTEARKKYNEQLLAFKSGKDWNMKYDQDYNGNKVQQSISVKIDKDEIEKTKKELEEFTTYYTGLGKKINSLKLAGFSDAEIEELMPNAISEFEEYNRVLAETSDKSLQANESNKELKEGLENVAMTAEEAKGKFEELSDTFGGYSEKLKFLNKVQKEFAETGGLTDSSIQTLVSKYGELSYLLLDQANFQQNLQKEIKNTTDAYDKSYQEIIDTVKIANGQIDRSNVERINKMLNDEADFANFVSSIYDQDARNFINSLQARLNSYAEYIREKARLGQFDSATDTDDLRAEQRYLETLNALQNAIAKQLGTNTGVSNVGTGHVKPSNPSGGSSGGGSSSKQEIADLELKLDRYRDLNNAIDKLNDAMAYNESLMKNASDDEKVRLLKEQAKLYEQQKKAVQDLIAEQNRHKNELKSQLSNNGFTIVGDDLINAEDRLKSLQNWANSLSGEAKKSAIEKVKELESIVKLYNDLIRNDIPNANKQIIDINNSLIDSQKQIVDIIKQQKDEWIKAEEEKTQKIKDEIQKRKDAMNKEWEQEDYEDKLAEEQSKLDELQSALRNAMREGNQALVDSLRKQIEDQEKVINDTIRDNEREQANDKYDEEMDNLDSALEDKIDSINKKLTDEELLKYVQNGVTSLEDVLNSIGQSTQDINRTFTGVGVAIKDGWLGNLELFESKLKAIKTTFNTLSMPDIASRAVANTGVGSVNIEIPINIEGDLTKDTLGDLKAILEDTANNIKNEIYNSFNR